MPPVERIGHQLHGGDDSGKSREGRGGRAGIKGERRNKGPVVCVSCSEFYK